MDNEPPPVMTREDVKNLVAEVLQQSGRLPADCPPPPKSDLKEGNDFTLAAFSMLQYNLGSRNLSSNGPLTQTLSVRVNTDDELVFDKELPDYAVQAVVVHSNKLPPQVETVLGGQIPCPIPLRDPAFAVAVQLRDCHKKIRDIAFVTHDPKPLPSCGDPCCHGGHYRSQPDTASE
ncbi:hypothetical protein ACFWPK_09415 [Nocardia sp. NPDC058519]|uniref:hypothetical protein n=1 Tax=unclassified Nocardia TaxID=2637762 RepID=UPI003656E7DA